MVRRRSIRDIKQGKLNRRGALLITVVLICTIALVAGYVWVARQQIELNPQSMCPVSGVRGVTAVLVDMTDPLDPVQKEALRQEFTQIKRNIPVGTALQVYSVMPVDDQLLAPVAPAVCNPGEGRNTNRWIGNPTIVEKRWHEGFEKPVDLMLEKMLDVRTAPTSPILESIQSVAITAFGGLPQQAEYRRLVIVSDMLQNTSDLSQYREIKSFSDFHDTPYYLKVRANLRGVNVEIIYLRRDNGMQGTKHIQFWEDYFRDCGAFLEHVMRLQG